MAKDRWKKIVGVLLVSLWFLIVLFKTVIGRAGAEETRMELRLFWCLKEAWLDRNPFDWYLVIGNIILFIPIGIILPLFFVDMRRRWKTACVGFCFSMSVEVLQLTLRLGLFELDDMVNNTFGCVLGYSLFVICIWLSKKERVNIADRMISLGIWIMTIAFLIVAIYMGQPVFDMFLS